MFNLIRRISGSIIQRPDRPWPEDATSNAPQVGRKRRHSSAERDEDADATLKRVKGLSDPATREDSPATVVPPAQETKDVKDVTKGVKTVELEETDPTADTSLESAETTVGTPPTEPEAPKVKATQDGEVDAQALKTPLPPDDGNISEPDTTEENPAEPDEREASPAGEATDGATIEAPSEPTTAAKKSVDAVPTLETRISSKERPAVDISKEVGASEAAS